MPRVAVPAGVHAYGGAIPPPSTRGARVVVPAGVNACGGVDPPPSTRGAVPAGVTACVRAFLPWDW